MVGVPEAMFFVPAVLLGLVSLVVPFLGLYLLWQIKTSVMNMERTLATLARDRQ